MWNRLHEPFRIVYYNTVGTIVKTRASRGIAGIGHRTARTTRRLTQAVVDLVFPPRCLLCDGWPDEAESTSLCASCAGTIALERGEPACPRCAASVAPYEVSGGRCGKCRSRRPHIAGTVRVGPYSEGLGQFIRSYKYRQREELGSALGGWLAETIRDAPWLHRVEAVVAVPTHWRHRLTRPLYAAEALAAIVARRAALPLAPVLMRVRGGPHQIGLSFSARAENVRGAFAIRRGVTLNDARLLLIDDVKTTGATLNECAKVLRRAGAAELYAAVVVTAGWDTPSDQSISSI